MIFKGIILSTLFLSSSVFAGSFGCKDSNGKLYISKTPCSMERASSSGRGYISEQDLRHLTSAHESLNSKAKKNKKKYLSNNKLRSVKACFATTESPHEKGESISYRGFRFKCMQIKQSNKESYSFYPIDLLRQCRYRPNNPECSSWDNETKYQLFGQL